MGQAGCLYRGRIPEARHDVLGYRDREKIIFDALRDVFKSRNIQSLKKDNYDIDIPPETFLLWINENLPREYLDIDDLVKGYDAITKAEIIVAGITVKEYQIEIPQNAKQYSPDPYEVPLVPDPEGKTNEVSIAVRVYDKEKSTLISEKINLGRKILKSKAEPVPEELTEVPVFEKREITGLITINGDTFMRSSNTGEITITLKKKVADLFLNEDTWTVFIISHDKEWEREGIKTIDLEDHVKGKFEYAGL